jgi:hypothetical protein
MVWVSVVDGKMCFCRPKGELMVLAWDIARMLARRQIGTREFEAERHLSLVSRTHTAIFKRISFKLPFRATSDEDICFPETIILEDSSLNTNSGRINQKGKSCQRGLLEGALLAQSVHESQFWKATSEIPQRIHAIMNAIQICPRISLLSTTDRNDILKALVASARR